MSTHKGLAVGHTGAYNLNKHLCNGMQEARRLQKRIIHDSLLCLQCLLYIKQRIQSLGRAAGSLQQAVDVHVMQHTWWGLHMECGDVAPDAASERSSCTPAKYRQIISQATSVTVEQYDVQAILFHEQMTGLWSYATSTRTMTMHKCAVLGLLPQRLIWVVSDVDHFISLCNLQVVVCCTL